VETGKLRWSLETAVNPIATVLGDVTGDAELEIVIGTYATANGAVLDDGTDDEHSYVYVLNRDGQLLWRREFGGEFTRAVPSIADLDGDGTLDLLVLSSGQRCFRSSANEVGSIYRLDRNGAVAAVYEIGVEVREIRVARLRTGGPMQIIAADRLGRLHLIGPDFSLRACVQLIGPAGRDVVTHVQAIDDLDEDGNQEIIASTWEVERRITPVSGQEYVAFTYDHTVFVLDANLAIQARRQLYVERKHFPGLRVIPCDAKTGARKQLIVLADEARVFEFTK
jgi:hypothetical protein